MEILIFHFLVFTILEAAQLLHRNDMSVLTGGGSCVEKRLGYVIEIGHIDSESLLQFLSLLNADCSMAGMVLVLIVAQAQAQIAKLNAV